MEKRQLSRSIIIVAMPVALGFLSLSIGRFSIPMGKLFSILFLNDRSDRMMVNVIFSLRLPRIILSILVGAGLSVSGLAFQNLFSNPLASPDTLAVASGASLGAILSLLLGFSLVGMQLVSLAFGLLAIAVTWFSGRRDGPGEMTGIILTGIIVGSLCNSFVSLAKFLANPETELPAITYWLMGSLSSANWMSLRIGAPPILVGCLVLYLIRWRMNILPLGEDEAKATGSDLGMLRGITVLSATLITASSVSMAGQVGWVGLLVPHMARMWKGSDNTRLVPLTISLGASFMLVIDTLARSVSATEIPVSILTSIVGAPFFISLVRRKGGWGL